MVGNLYPLNFKFFTIIKETHFLFLLIFILCGNTLSAQVETDSVYTEVDEMPVFEGCNDPLISAKQRQACTRERLIAFVKQNITYPDSARIKGVEGLAMVRFVVMADGQIGVLQLLRDVPEGCGKEAMRIVRSMPNWTPGKLQGQKVAVELRLPIRFSLKEEDGELQNRYRLNWGTLYKNTVKRKDLEALAQEKLFARDYFGNVYELDDLEVTYVKGRKVRSAFSRRGRINRAMERIIQKAKPKGVVILRANIKVGYEVVEIIREIDIIRE